MKIVSRVIITLVILVILSGTSFAAAVWFVNKTGCRLPDGNYHAETIRTNTTIQGAILTIARTGTVGDSLVICNESAAGVGGYYAENISINISINITSFGGARTPNITHGVNVPTGGIINISVNNVNMSNLSINTTTTNGIYIDGFNYTSMSGINLTSTTTGVPLAISNANGTSIQSAYIFDGTGYGIHITNSNYTTIASNVFGNLSGAVNVLGVPGSTNNLSVRSNTIENTTSFGIRMENLTNSTFNSNILRNMSTGGFFAYNSSRLAFGSNIIAVNLSGISHGFVLNLTTNSTLTSNRVENTSGVSFFLFNSTNNTLVSNIVRRTSDTRTGVASAAMGAFLLWNSSTNMLDSNTVNESNTGFHVFNLSHNNTFVNNMAYNNSMYGFQINLSSFNTTFRTTLNTAHNNSIAGFFVADVPGASGTFTNISMVNATNNSVYGFHIVNSSIFISAANASGNLVVQYMLANGSNMTFTGRNDVQYTPAASWELNASDGSKVSTLYAGVYHNFTSEYLSLTFDAAENISVKTMNWSSGGFNAPPALDNCNSDTGDNCLYLPFDNLVNITNNSGFGTMQLGMYYNLTKATGINTTQIYISKYVSSEWDALGQTAIDAGAGFVRYGTIDTFSLFGVVGIPDTSIAGDNDDDDSSGSSSSKYLSIDYDVDCPGVVQIEVDEGQADVSLVLADPYGGQIDSGQTDESGVINLQLTKHGVYDIYASKSGYRRTLESFTFDEVCETEEEVIVEVPQEDEEVVVSEEEETPQQVGPTRSEAQNEIDAANRAIVQAQNGGKDVQQAAQKLLEARQALERNEFERAKMLAQEAARIAAVSKPLPPRTTTTQPQATVEETPVAEAPKNQGIDPRFLAIAGISILVLAGGAYYLMNMSKKGR